MTAGLEAGELLHGGWWAHIQSLPLNQSRPSRCTPPKALFSFPGPLSSTGDHIPGFWLRLPPHPWASHSRRSCSRPPRLHLRLNPPAASRGPGSAPVLPRTTPPLADQGPALPFAPQEAPFGFRAQFPPKDGPRTPRCCPCISNPHVSFSPVLLRVC